MNHHASKLKFALAAAAATLMTFAPAASASPDTFGKKAVAKKLAIAAPSSVDAGAKFDLTVSAVSKKGKPIKTFKGAVALKSTDAGATLPGTYKFKKSDKGRHVFTGVSLATAGAQSVTATGPKAVRGAYSVTVKGAPAGGSGGETGFGSGTPTASGGSPGTPPVDPGTPPPAEPGPLASFVLSTPASVEAGRSIGVTARGADAAGNDLGDVTNRLALTIGPDGSCSAAVCSATKSGSHTVTATVDGVARTAQVEVTTGPLASLVLTAPSAVTAGEGFSPNVTGRDEYGNSRGDVTGQATFSLGGSACTSGSCRGTTMGAQTLAATVGGVSSTTQVTVHPGPLASIDLSAPSGAIAPAAPNHASAQYTGTRAASKRFTAIGRDAYGNSRGDVSALATFSAGGRNCGSALCGGGDPSTTETVTAAIGDVRANASLEYASLADSYEMACRGENYDVNQNLADGCERSQPDPGHATKATAIDLGSKSCSDSASQTTISGVMLSDNRKHVDPFRAAGSNPPVITYKVRATGGVCVNDMAIAVRTSGGQDGGAACYRVKVNTNYYEDSGAYDGDEYREGSTGGRYYADNSDLYITVERICGDNGPEAVDYTISFHL